jgi:hypothetical protein
MLIIPVEKSDRFLTIVRVLAAIIESKDSGHGKGITDAPFAKHAILHSDCLSSL